MIRVFYFVLFITILYFLEREVAEECSGRIFLSFGGILRMARGQTCCRQLPSRARGIGRARSDVASEDLENSHSTLFSQFPVSPLHFVTGVE